jgi:acetyl esterase/lipase
MKTAALILLLAAATARADDPTVIDLWPGPPPGEQGGPVGDEKLDRGKENQGPIRGITNVSKPTLTVSRPDKARDTGVAVIVCPGGGYNMLAWDHEGEQVASWLNSLGATAVLLKYRVPRRADTPKGQPPRQALMDAQRALGLVRS